MTTSALVFRKATTKDVSEISLNESTSHVSPWTPPLIEESLTGSHLVWVMEIRQQVIGHIVILPVLEQWELLNIVVVPKFQSQGIGREAMNFIFQQAQLNQIKTIFLEVRRSNRTARELYLSCDFEEVGVRKNYYRSEVGREDAIIMQASIE